MDKDTENNMPQMGAPLYESTSHGIRVCVLPRYIPEQSNPASHIFFYSYTITLTNENTHSAQLLRRHWEIQNAMGETRHVDGEGVVGEQPILAPGESYSYTSFCPLDTPSGSIKGHYDFKTSQNMELEIEIPEFSLTDITLMN